VNVCRSTWAQIRDYLSVEKGVENGFTVYLVRTMVGVKLDSTDISHPAEDRSETSISVA
jgi:hypothetical protein